MLGWPHGVAAGVDRVEVVARGGRAPVVRKAEQPAGTTPVVSTARRWTTVTVGVLFLVAAAWLWWPGMRDLGRRNPTADGGEVSQPAAAPDPAREYLAFADGLSTNAPRGDEVLVEGLRKLAGALGTLEGVEPEVPIDLRIVAEHILLNPESAETTAVVRTSLVAAADSLDRDRGGASELRPAVDAIDPQIPLSRQRDRMIQMFVAAAARIEQGSPQEAHDVP
jgi:hypothetical protein